MMTFLLSFLGGAFVSGSFVALKTPRNGKENQRALNDYVTDVKYQSEQFKDATQNVAGALNQLMLEVDALQYGFVPEMEKSMRKFEEHAEIHQRRIEDRIEKINDEVEDFERRVQNQ